MKACVYLIYTPVLVNIVISYPLGRKATEITVMYIFLQERKLPYIHVSLLIFSTPLFPILLSPSHSPFSPSSPSPLNLSLSLTHTHTHALSLSLSLSLTLPLSQERIRGSSCRSGTRQVRSAIAPSPQPTTEEPWGSSSCLTSPTKSHSTQLKDGTYHAQQHMPQCTEFS